MRYVGYTLIQSHPRGQFQQQKEGDFVLITKKEGVGGTLVPPSKDSFHSTYPDNNNNRDSVHLRRCS
jgi:hypothetical protein